MLSERDSQVSHALADGIVIKFVNVQSQVAQCVQVSSASGSGSGGGLLSYSGNRRVRGKTLVHQSQTTKTLNPYSSKKLKMKMDGRASKIRKVNGRAS